MQVKGLLASETCGRVNSLLLSYLRLSAVFVGRSVKYPKRVSHAFWIGQPVGAPAFDRGAPSVFLHSGEPEP